MYTQPELHSIQIDLEHKYSKKNIKQAVMDDLKSNEEIVLLIDKAISMVMDSMMKDHGYESKNKRMQLLMNCDIEDCVTEILFHLARVGRAESLTTLSGLVAPVFNMTIVDALTTAGDLTLIISKTGLISLEKNQYNQMWYVNPNFQLPELLVKFIKQTMYLPPMVVEPNKLTHNRSAGYLTTATESVIKGGNKKHHALNVCLDSLNKFNSIPLSLDVKQLKTISDRVPTHNKYGEEFTAEEKEQFRTRILESYDVYKTLVSTGNKFHLTHGTDNRGRTYANGYHVNYQSRSFLKSIVNFHNKEIVEL